MDIKISIIVPIYNVYNYLSKCIDSILEQTFKEFEVILINDGSTDGSGMICDKYAQIDPRIKVIHKINGGVSSARNTGLKYAKGEFIGFVDPDDYVYKDMFLTLYTNCIKNKAEVTICRSIREINGVMSEEKSNQLSKLMSKEEALKELFKATLYRFSLCNKLFKKSCFKGVAFPEGRIHEDLSVTYQLIGNAKKICYIDYIGYVYVKRDNSILTKKYNENRLQSLLAWDEIYIYMKIYKEVFLFVEQCLIFWLIDNVIYIINSDNNYSVKLMYLNKIRNFILKHDFLINHIKKNIIECKILLLLIIKPQLNFIYFKFGNLR